MNFKNTFLINFQNISTHIHFIKYVKNKNFVENEKILNILDTASLV